MLSILTPAFNEATNLDALHARLVETMARIGGEWEWVVVDDHSRDDTFAVLTRLATADPRVRGLRLSRNSGSHVAITCALHHVSGEAAALLAADLQDPPEVLDAMVERWRAGSQVVWAMRRQQPGEAAHAGFASVYYGIMRHVVGMKDMPARGADVFLIDRAVVDAFRRFPERNTSVLALITWLGFRQEYIEYDKQPRASGKSGWTLARKITLVIDSVTSFTEAPIRVCSYAGAGIFAAGIALSLIALVRWLAGASMGHLGLLAAMTTLSGIQLLALGIVGEYVWRALEESRRRPPYLVEAATSSPGWPPSVDAR